MPRGKRSRSDDDGWSRREYALAGAVVSLLAIVTFPIWSPYIPNIPFPGGDGVGQGLKLTGTVEFANHTSVSGTSYTCTFVDKETRSSAYSGTISGGTFTTNKGPEDGGTFVQYISISGCHLFVREVDVPKAEDWDHDTYSVDPAAIIFPETSLTGSNWNVLVTAGSVANSFTGGGSAASTNFSATAGSAQSFDWKIENQKDYSKLFRDYTDPYDATEDGEGVPVAPCLWVTVGTETNVYQGQSYKSWQAGGSTTYLIPLDAITCTGTADMNVHWDIDLTFSSAANVSMQAWIVDGSHPTYLYQARSRVAQPASGETVTTVQILDTYVQIS